MRNSLATLTILVFAVAAFADDAADRAKLIGTWQLEHGSDKDGSQWTLQSKGDTIRIVHSQNTQKLADFQCNTAGRDCDVTDAGHSAKVSLYYNGPKLVQFETQGSQVVKCRLGVNAQGDTMEVEVIPVVPAGKTEVLEFKRVQAVADSK